MDQLQMAVIVVQTFKLDSVVEQGPASGNAGNQLQLLRIDRQRDMRLLGGLLPAVQRPAVSLL